MQEEKYVPQSIETVVLEQIKGSEKAFPLCGKELVVSAETDAFNTYRKEFKKMAKMCADNAVHEYLDKVHNFDTFVENFLDIYNRNLEALTKKAVDILVAEEIYTISHEEYTSAHKKTFRYALDDYDVLMESCRLTEESNNQVNSAFSNAFQGVMGSVINQKTSGVANSFLTGMTQGIMENAVAGASKLTEPQKRELFGRITPHIMFNKILCDYWNVYLSLAGVLKQNGVSIFVPSNDSNEAIFNNLTNPNFKQDKVVEVFLDIVKNNPYNEKYYEFMKQKFGETDEVKCIIEYFGYDESSITYKEEDYPKPIIEEPETQNISQTGEADLKTEFKGAVDSVLKAAKDSDFAKSFANKFGFKK